MDKTECDFPSSTLFLKVCFGRSLVLDVDADLLWLPVETGNGPLCCQREAAALSGAYGKNVNEIWRTSSTDSSY